MRLDPRWIRVHVVRPALERVGLWSEAAEVLVTGTAIVESNACWTRQIGGGPALGLWQMEPATHRSLWADLLSRRLGLAGRILELVDADLPGEGGWQRLAVSIEPHLIAYAGASSAPALFWYAAAMARVRYLWDRHPLPAADHAEALAECWKRAYNTVHGAGTVRKAIPAFEEAIRCE